jgi:hypothetical protein
VAKFGLDDTLIKKFKKELEIRNVRADQLSDFFILPQLDVIYRFCGEELKELVSSKLSKSIYGPKPPIEMEVPKNSRVSSKASSLIGPNYFRPGSILLPEDRIVYHFIAQEASSVIEASLNRKAVFSNKPLPTKGQGFTSPSSQWIELRKSLEKEIKTGNYAIALKTDISQYFFSINQHELVNQLEHQGFQTEMVKFSEKFFSGLTLDRSSRGILQGLYASDVLGNGYLSAIDEFISSNDIVHFRYVDDMYFLFRTSEEMKDFFPLLVKRLRDYDLSLNESKTFIAAPTALLRQETELDKAIAAAKKEAAEKLIDFEEIVVETGPYGETVTDILEIEPDEDEVELEATISIFNNLDDFKGDDRQRAENFCLGFFRRARDPIAVDYVAKRWLRHPDQAREYALYLQIFANGKNHQSEIDKMIIDSAEAMNDYQWSWAAFIMRRMNKMSNNLIKLALTTFKDKSQHDVTRSLLVYSICQNESAQNKKEIRDEYVKSPLLIQLAIIHSGDSFTSSERNALMKTAESHGDLQSLMCNAFKLEQKAKHEKA